MSQAAHCELCEKELPFLAGWLSCDRRGDWFFVCANDTCPPKPRFDVRTIEFMQDPDAWIADLEDEPWFRRGPFDAMMNRLSTGGWLAAPLGDSGDT